MPCHYAFVSFCNASGGSAGAAGATGWYDGTLKFEKGESLPAQPHIQYRSERLN